MISIRRKEPNATDKHVGTRIRMRRMMLGMSQSKLADAVNLTFQQIQKYEKGTNRVSASRMQQFAQILDVPVSFFFDGAPAAHVIGGGKVSGNSVVTPAYIADFLASHNGQNIIEAFSRIKDRKLQHTIVALVEQIAGLKQRR
jgi:transcriptional regulator with XRE-family HTH domain